jgi:hypothetical protein
LSKKTPRHRRSRPRAMSDADRDKVTAGSASLSVSAGGIINQPAHCRDQPEPGIASGRTCEGA